MAVVSGAALICDTGALLDYLVEGSTDHERFRDAIDGARARYLPGLVLAEVDYFLRDERPAMNVFMSGWPVAHLLTRHQCSISSLGPWRSIGDTPSSASAS
ncbi:MAG TPA: PIN domain-containing protein [Vicinamibacteria bacterium]|nr:PIN domain-containing protein [Vicinamibacteria bacterium]